MDKEKGKKDKEKIGKVLVHPELRRRRLELIGKIKLNEYLRSKN